jgi:hypothetical protein
MDSKLNICIIGDDIRHHSSLDMNYLSKTFNIKELKPNWQDNIDEDVFNDMFKWILKNNVHVIITEPFWSLPNPEEINKFFDKIREHSHLNHIPIVYMHVMFPSVRNISYEENSRKGFIYLTDFATNQFDNCIEIPLLAVANMDDCIYPDVCNQRNEKQFISNQFEDMYEREYDIKLKIGKPKTTRVLTALMLLKYDIYNFYTNVSYSKEVSDPGTYEEVLEFLKIDLDDVGEFDSISIIDKYKLSEYFDKIKIESYLGPQYGNGKMYTSRKKLPDLGYTVDFNSYSEVYTESISCEIKINTLYPKLISFTEKTFNNFIFNKIPLAVDTKDNIDYLKKIGFKFPIEPCYLLPEDTYDDIAMKLEKWCIYLKTFDFKELWHKWYYADYVHLSPLRHNHNLIYTLMRYTEGDYQMSVPTYASTYKFIEKLFPDKLEDYKNWDNPKYRFLIKKGLI